MFVERAAGILLFDRQLAHALLIQDRDGAWRFPSGRNLAEESFLDAAIRELWEETGIGKEQFEVLAPPIPLVSSRHDPERGRFTKLTYLYPAVLAGDSFPALRLAEVELLGAEFCPVQSLERTTNSLGRYSALVLAYSALQASIACEFAPVLAAP